MVKHFLWLAVAVGFICCALSQNDSDLNVKDIAEDWFVKQAPHKLGKKFLERVKCSQFLSFFANAHPNFYGSGPKATRDEVSSVCEKQRQIERDRRDLQDYAVRYFKDPEETELSSCNEFADDFVSEYPRFKVKCSFPQFINFECRTG
mmetsp:Transcript_40126/g.107560  ORF Transcript_40126/g.107560 Transcript_40126/m.107560 type:complete len:148 (-) Transcript_40126:234-677(-)